MGRKGFSLVELSIVLVVLGLLVGGILSGQSLIEAAELRSVVREYNAYASSIYSFKEKYSSYPGDINNATKFWGAPGGDVTNCPATIGTGTETCDGNGSGDINISGTAGNAYNEKYTFWQHLSNADLIDGRYTGVSGPANHLDSTLGVNTPQSKFGNAGWDAYTANGGNSNIYNIQYNTRLQIGAKRVDTGTYDEVFTPVQAYSIDKKVDDGKPAYGKVIAVKWNNLCSAADDGNHTMDNLEASYRLTDDSVQCGLIFRNVFQ